MHNVSCSGNCTLYADHIIDVGTRLLYTIGVVLCFSSENYSAGLFNNLKKLWSAVDGDIAQRQSMHVLEFPELHKCLFPGLCVT